MTGGPFQASEEFAAAMDARDPLAHFRERFCLPKTKSGDDCIYLCGHSLGLQPKTARAYLDQELHDWAQLGVEGHFHAKNPWMPYHRLLTQQTAALVGAQPEEVVVMNSLTVNLHLMMVSFYRPTTKRHKILIERGAFPSDQYAVKSQIRFHGFDPASSLLELTPRDGETCMRDEDIESLIEREGDSIALIMLGGVNYATGQAFDMAAITKAGRRKGCVVGFDLAHAAGNIPLRLHDWGPDFAVWCSYKYLNGGPGCVAGCFVHERHARAWELPRFAGWWGHEEKIRFQMGPEFHPMAGAEGWQLSNPPILALAASACIDGDFFRGGHRTLASQERFAYRVHGISARSRSLLEGSRSSRRMNRSAEALSSRSACAGDGRKLCDRLAAEGVIGDWREPDTFRVAAVPLYNSYQDVYQFVQRFSAALS